MCRLKALGPHFYAHLTRAMPGRGSVWGSGAQVTRLCPSSLTGRPASSLSSTQYAVTWLASGTAGIGERLSDGWASATLLLCVLKAPPLCRLQGDAASGWQRCRRAGDGEHTPLEVGVAHGFLPGLGREAQRAHSVGAGQVGHQAQAAGVEDAAAGLADDVVDALLLPWVLLQRGQGEPAVEEGTRLALAD